VNTLTAEVLYYNLFKMKSAPWSRAILHLDMDAFFASVEQRDHPELRGKPVIVGANPDVGRGVVSTASYEARRFGVRSAMPIVQAVRLCPHGIFVPCDFKRYMEVSRQIHEIMARYTPELEMLSSDEAFMDVTRSQLLFGDAVEIARSLKYDIALETRLTCSVGVSGVKFVSKIASDLHKPDGLTIVRGETERAFLERLPISRLWGVGAKTQEMLERRGIHTVGDLAWRRERDLKRMFGDHGSHLWRLANAIDLRDVHWQEREPKSIGQEQTFSVDVIDASKLERALLWLTEKAATRARRDSLCARTVVLKFRHANFQTLTRQTALSESANDTITIYRAAHGLLQAFLPLQQAVRLIGVSLRNLEPERSVQSSLFSRTPKLRRLEGGVDAVRARFGRESLTRALLLEARGGVPRGAMHAKAALEE
jgi:DNA polymerase IV